ncbi:glycosyltransferase family 1 protein [Baudoinia panamericana UAMH 10762]|uniref:Glycosyltransferase family 1 protein n=1 Tax=Baudoinia panamericana (strain UAMH 10762) TaxID=717646 RepID=M2M859_BAUPA|nr:glycosyltransferase family 1 protein [Baudoinia panamericana UAMH 10762]EMC92526.1 glycosyltransferase family 1 protein [Baudoinia panamericana UAMH 10762]
MLSDSESSSSEDDVEAKQKPRQQSAAATQPQRTDATDFASERQRKEQAKKGHSYSRFHLGNEHFRSKGRISRRDGRLNISINETANSGYIAKALGQSIRHHLDIPKRRKSHEHRHLDVKKEEDDKLDTDAASIASSLRTTAARPRLNIVIMVIGSRGDIQPFLKIGKILKNEYGHRVRIASHPTFRDFVEKDTGLDFFSVGGDPSELMAFMVKNPGLIPNIKTIREGEIQRRRAAMAVMFEGFWRACVNTTDDEKDIENLKMMGDKQPFIADAIIANPPSMAHVHIAEKLGIPLHMMFTFPYSPTEMFPHPLANIKPRKSNVDENYVNFMSFPLVEMMTWQGLGDIVNKFRERTLGLEPVSSLWAPGALYRMKVPYTYLWSPSLVPKPKDWGPEIDIAGFVFLDLASNFQPSQELTDFLSAGEPPVYIGFGSIVVDDPNAFTEMIFEATRIAGVRALVNKGWGGLGQDGSNTPDHIFMLGNTPHDWLFPKVQAVVHHGGAGTTAIGLKCGKPTMIVPFFGDQPFWGAMVAEAKAGAHKCIPYKHLTAERLAEGIKQCLTEEARRNVQRIADSIVAEGDGAENAVKSFHRSLPLAGRKNMRCSILQDRVAVWQLRKSSLRLSALAAELLYERGKIRWSDLKLLRHYEWADFDGPGEPITGSVGAVKDSLYGIGEGVGMVPVRIAKHIRQREEHTRKKQHVRRKKEERQRRKAVRKAEKEGIMNPTMHNNAINADAGPGVPRKGTSNTVGSTLSADPSVPLAREVAEDVGLGLRRAGGALITAPNDLHVAIAQGFHNAPRLWGDATVRKPVRITGFKSGCNAAGKEFVYGIWDGWTGLISQPVGEWRDADTMPTKLAGLSAGIGKGVGGFVLKNINAVVAPPAYFGKGIVRYAENKIEGGGSKQSIRRAHIIQGQKDGSEDAQHNLQDVKSRVSEGWRTYEEIWREANQIGRNRLRREKKSWDVNGALENVDTANRALRTKKDGHDLDRLFAKRRRELAQAEQPRAPAMEQVATFAEDDKVLPNGHVAGTANGSRAEVASQHLGAEQNPQRYLDQTEETKEGGALSDNDEAGSGTTAVATPEDDNAGGDDGHEKARLPGQLRFGEKAASLSHHNVMQQSRVVS